VIEPQRGASPTFRPLAADFERRSVALAREAETDFSRMSASSGEVTTHFFL